MKLVKPIFIIIAGLLVSMTGLLQAQQGYHAYFDIYGGPPSSPQVSGTTNWVPYIATNAVVYGDDCEMALFPTNNSFSWSSTYGTWATNTSNPAYWTNVFRYGGWYTNVITCNATLNGTDCDGTNYTIYTNACVTNIIQVLQAYKISFDDSPNRSHTRWPWTWEATLQAVLVSGTNNTSTNFSTSYTNKSSITYGFSVDVGGNVTNVHKSGDGNIGDMNKIVVRSHLINVAKG